MIARAVGCIDLRCIGHIRKIEPGLDADTDEMFLFFMSRVLRYRPLLTIQEKRE